MACSPLARREPAAAGGRPKFDFSTFAKIMTEELIPFIDANYRTIADQPHRALAGLSMEGAQTRQITPGQLRQVLEAHRALLRAAASRRMSRRWPTRRPSAGRRSSVLFVSYGKARRTHRRSEGEPRALEKLGIKNTYYESPNTAHEWQTWRRSLYQLRRRCFGIAGAVRPASRHIRGRQLDQERADGAVPERSSRNELR